MLRVVENSPISERVVESDSIPTCTLMLPFPTLLTDPHFLFKSSLVQYAKMTSYMHYIRCLHRVCPHQHVDVVALQEWSAFMTQDAMVMCLDAKLQHTTSNILCVHDSI